MLRIALALPIAASLLFFTACEQLPATIDESAQVDQYLAQKRYRAACVGLQSRDDEIVTYAAQRLVEYPHIKDATECLCTALYDDQRHEVGLPAGKGTEGSGRNDLAACVQPGLSDTVLTDERRQNLVQVLADLGAADAYGILADLMQNDADPEIRARAASGLRPARSQAEALVTSMQTDASPEVRAAAASALDGHKGDEVAAALTAAALEDEDGGVRAAAMAVMAKGKRSSRTHDMLCTAMNEDEDARVRTAAVKAYHGTKRKASLDCVGRRLVEEEESATVRQAAMDALKASPSDHVKPLLCQAVAPVVRRYIDNQIPNSDNDASGTHIMKAQNDRDWEASYACVSKALGQGGYTCGGRWYLINWYNNLGGNRKLPDCPGLSNL